MDLIFIQQAVTVFYLYLLGGMGLFLYVDMKVKEIPEDDERAQIKQIWMAGKVQLVPYFLAGWPILLALVALSIIGSLFNAFSKNTPNDK